MNSFFLMNKNSMCYFDTYIKPWCHIWNNSSLCYNRLISKLPFLAVANLKNQKANWKFGFIHWQVLNIWTWQTLWDILTISPTPKKPSHSYCLNKISTEFPHKTNNISATNFSTYCSRTCDNIQSNKVMPYVSFYWSYWLLYVYQLI